MNQESYRIDRRELIIGSAAAIATSTAGCRGESETGPAEGAPRRDVPLRIALSGSERDAEAIARGWGAISEQPLRITTMAFDRTESDAFANTLLEEIANSDLAIYPLAFIAEAVAAESIVTLSDDDFEMMEQSAGSMAPALRNGAARYAGDNVAVPLGGLLPAILSNEEFEPVQSWDQYDELVEQVWKGSAAEPSAPGWAAAMFLWRSSGIKSWLFGREDLQPLVETEPYVETLEQMVSTHAKYEFKRQTPAQVWEGVTAGQWRGGIGFPNVRVESDGEFRILNLPGTSDISKVLLDGFSPVVSLSANCRQSAAAKQFMQWICGGEGSRAIRQQVPGMSDIVGWDRDGGGDDAILTQSSYDQWLGRRLNAPVTLPCLQLLRAGEYYGALDQQVGLALDGEVSAESALSAVAEKWAAITGEVGRDRQLRCWRRAQGMRA